MSEHFIQSVASSNASSSNGLARPISMNERIRRGTTLAWREGLPLLGWQIKRTGSRGLVGIGLLCAAAVFFTSTHWPLVTQVQSMRDELQTAMESAARHAAHAPVVASNDPRRLLESLPERSEVPKILGVLLVQADNAGLSIDTGKYAVVATHTRELTRYHVGFPVTGTYPAIRTFINQVLKEIPTASISELSIERKTIADGAVEANIRLTLFTRGTP